MQSERREKRTQLRIGEKLVLVDDGGDGHFVRGISAFDSHDAAFAAHPYAFGESDFRRQGESEIDSRAGLQGGIDVEADAAGADIAGLRGMLLLIGFVADSYRQTKRETPRSALIVFMLVVLRFGHGDFPGGQGCIDPSCKGKELQQVARIACKHGKEQADCQALEVGGKRVRL